MDTNEDQNEENVDVATASVDQPDNTNTNNTSSATSASGLQQIEDDDNDDLPLPNGMAEEISNRAEPPKQKIGKVEQIDDDNIGPEPPAAMLEASLNAADITNKIAASSSAVLTGSASDMNLNQSTELVAYLTEALQSGKISAKEVQDILNALEPTSTTTSIAEYTNELSPPTPFNSAKFEDDADTIAKKKAKDEMMNKKPAAVEVLTPSNRDSIYEPSRELVEGSDGISDNTNTGRGDTNRRGWEDIESRMARRDIESQQTRPNDNHELTAGSINDILADAQAANVEPTSINQEGLPEVEAYLVEDLEEEEVEVYMATPTLPWWKQRRTKILLGVVLVIVSTLAIVLGIELSKDDSTVNMIVNSTNAPTVSVAPSSSMAPSSSPTECVNKIISNKQEIDLQRDLQVTDPLDPQVAVDGRNMVVVAKDGKYCTGIFSCFIYDGPAFITFYSLDNGKWQRVQTPIRVDDVSNSDGRVMYSVSLSGSAAFVGFPYTNDDAGIVLVYKQNDFGEWVRVNDPFVHIDNTIKKWFGSSIDIDGDLACVWYSNNMNLYHQDDDRKWVQFDTIEDGFECSISGDSIAVYANNPGHSIQLYKYNQGQNKVSPIQDPIPTARIFQSMDLRNDYLVYWDWDTDEDEQSAFFIYYRDETNETYTLHQQLNITGPRYKSIALDDDILVVKGYNQTHIYSLQDDSNWVESITLDESYDDIFVDLMQKETFEISGRTLLFSTKNNNSSLSSKIYAFNIQDCTQDMPTQSPTLSPSSPPTVSSLPTTTFRFTWFDADDGGRYGILYDAVRAYVDQDCVNNEECDIAQVYGWPMNSWCVRHVKDMSGLFSSMSTFNEDISDWDTSSVTDMSFMFSYASLFSGDVSKFDTSSVTSMSYMFSNAKAFNGDVSNFDTSSVTNGINVLSCHFLQQRLVKL